MNTNTSDEVATQCAKLMNLFLNNNASNDEAYRQGWSFVEDFINRGGFTSSLLETSTLKIDIFESSLHKLTASRTPLSD